MFEEKIAVLEQKKADLESKIEYYKNYKPPIDEKEAYKNTIDALFDGVKYIADPDNPFTLSFPMYVVANMYYNYTENDGIKDVTKRYVCIKTDIVEELDEEHFVEF